MKNIIVINVKGKNIPNFIKKLNVNKIELIKIIKINRKEINIWINNYDYDKVIKLKTIYKVEIVSKMGPIKIRDNIKKYNILIVMIILSIVGLYTLSNIIFKVEVIHNESSVRNLLIEELKQNGIKKYSFIKSFKEVENIKNTILNKYKDSIEWLEIDRIGTKYTVKLELRKLNEKKDNNKLYDVIAKKDGIIKKIEASSGEIKKEVNQYVKKGDTIISGNILLNENYKGSIGATGNIYAEVWYQVNVEYPFIYNEEKLTNNKKNNYSLNIFNKRITLFKSYKNKHITKNNIITNLFVPISISKDIEEEIILIEEINTIEEAINKAKNLAIQKIEANLNEFEYIITSKVLSINQNESKIICEIFFTVYENIAEYKEIEVIYDKGNTP